MHTTYAKSIAQNKEDYVSLRAIVLGTIHHCGIIMPGRMRRSFNVFLIEQQAMETSKGMPANCYADLEEVVAGKDGSESIGRLMQ